MAHEEKFPSLSPAIIAGTCLDAPDPRAGNAIHDASTGAVIGWQPHADAAQVDAAVDAACAAGQAWRAHPPVLRGAVLRRIATGLEAQRASLAGLQQRVSGKPPAEADMDISDAVATFRYYADLCENALLFGPEAVGLPDEAVRGLRRYEAVGVAALIVPWNFPLVTTAWKIAPALAAGCTVVLKPSELTSPIEHRLAHIMAAAGVPAGAVNVVNGDGKVGAQLVAHPRIDKVSFTGSTAVGRQVMQAAAQDMKRLTLELGGKSALIVRSDADLSQAVALAISGAFTNAGQLCSATSRILVHATLYGPFMAALEAALRAMVVAPPHIEGVTMGPLISGAQRARVQALVARGVANGAAIAFEGALDASCGDGFFMAPVVAAEPAPDNVLWREEIFGPVACVKAFQTDDEAVALANDTRYGLVASVVTRDEAAAQRLRDELRAGLVWINTPQLIFPQVCWGGLGLSGIGRELGVAGLRSYQEMCHTLAARG